MNFIEVSTLLEYYALLFVNDHMWPVLTGIPSSHSHRLIIPDDVLKQFDLLMMSTVMLETLREVLGNCPT